MPSARNRYGGAIKTVGQHILRLYKQFATAARLEKVVGDNGSIEVFYFSGSDISSDDVVFETENDLNETPASRKSMVMDLLNAGLLSDETGRVSPTNKVKILEMMGFRQLGNRAESQSAAREKSRARKPAHDGGRRAPRYRQSRDSHRRARAFCNQRTGRADRQGNGGGGV